MNDNIKSTLFIIFAYLLGSISSSILLCRLFDLPDPRTKGSKNPGTTNILRVAGKKMAASVLFLDVFKGFILVYSSKLLELSSLVSSLVAFAVFLGQLFPLFFNFRGGKGIAITLGIILAFYWPLAILCLLIWSFIFIKTKISSLAGIIATIVAIMISIYNFISNNSLMPLEYAVNILCLGIFIIFKHKYNIIDLYNKKEKKFNF